MPLRRFRYDAKADIVKCPRGKVLRPGKPIKHGRFFHSRSRDCSRCDLKALFKGENRLPMLLAGVTFTDGVAAAAPDHRAA